MAFAIADLTRLSIPAIGVQRLSLAQALVAWTNLVTGPKIVTQVMASFLV